MRYGTQYEQGEIVIIPSPFTDLTSAKQCPALIISSNKYNQYTQDIIICGITSNLKNTEYSILIENKNLINGKIPIKSLIKVDKIFTIKQSLIKKKVGKIDETTFKTIQKEIIKITELD